MKLNIIKPPMYEIKVFVEEKSALFVMNVPVKRKLLTSYASHPCFVIVLIFFCFDLGFQEYFTCSEPIVHQRWAKIGETGEIPPDHP